MSVSQDRNQENRFRPFPTIVFLCNLEKRVTIKLLKVKSWRISNIVSRQVKINNFEQHPMEGTTAYWPYSDTLLQVMDACTMLGYMDLCCGNFGICTWIFNFLSWEVLLLYIPQNKIHLFEKLGKYWLSCFTVNIMLPQFHCCYCS